MGKMTTVNGGDPDDVRRKQAEEGNKGQHSDYVILHAEERAKGFVRPLRRTYMHLTCGELTTMGLSISETYAREPGFYGSTYCCACGAHYPVGENGEFVWDKTSIKVGT